MDSPEARSKRKVASVARRSGRSNRITVEQHPNLPPEQIEQYGYPFDILHALEQPNAVDKGAVEKTNLVARRKARTRGKMNEPAFVLAVAQRIDHLLGTGAGSSPLHTRWLTPIVELIERQRCRLPIDRNEEIAREQRRLHGIDTPGVTALLQVARKISLKALATEMRLRLVFGMWLGSHNVPAMASQLYS